MNVVRTLPVFFVMCLSIQSCELSRLDLKGVSLVSVVAGSWPLACFTAELVDVGKTNQTNNRVLRVFWCFAFLGHV